MNKKSILFCDDERWLVSPFTVALERDFDVHFCEDITNQEAIIVNRPDLKLIVMDVMMPTPAGVATSATNNSQSTGIWFLKLIRGVVISRPLPVILFSNKSKSALMLEVEPLGFDPKLVLVRSKNEVTPERLRQIVKETIDVWHP